MEYILSQQEWQDCIEFVLRTADNHSDAGRTNTNKKRRIMMGKTGEFAFSHLARQFGIETKSDLQKYEAGDTADFIINGKNIEVKTIKSNGNYLMIEPKKLCFHLAMEHPFPSAFVLAVNHWNWETDKPTKKITLAGYIYNYDLFDLQNRSIFLYAGQPIPDTETRLNQDNFIIPLSKLRQNWSALFQFLQV